LILNTRYGKERTLRSVLILNAHYRNQREPCDLHWFWGAVWKMKENLVIPGKTVSIAHNA
jgi:hypothetical protein